jgi:outer membrane lipoprotein-sorting protein
MKKFILFIFLTLPLVFLSSCGGGSSASLPTNKAVVFRSVDTFNNMTSATSAIKLITITATLPSGVFPNHSGNTLRIGETGLKGLKGNAFIPFGHYSANTNQVVFDVVVNNVGTDTIGFGDLARLTYTTNPGLSVSEANFQQFSYKVFGPGGSIFSDRVTGEAKLTTYPRP